VKITSQHVLGPSTTQLTIYCQSGSGEEVNPHQKGWVAFVIEEWMVKQQTTNLNGKFSCTWNRDKITNSTESRTQHSKTSLVQIEYAIWKSQDHCREGWELSHLGLQQEFLVTGETVCQDHNGNNLEWR